MKLGEKFSNGDELDRNARNTGPQDGPYDEVFQNFRILPALIFFKGLNLPRLGQDGNVILT